MRKKVVQITFVIALVAVGCSKEEPAPKLVAKPPKKTEASPALDAAPAPDPAAAPPGASAPAANAGPAPYEIDKGIWPAAPPRVYEVDGKIDLNALTLAMRDWCYYTNRFPTSMQELVTTHFLTNLPTPPPGKKFSINPSKNSVELVDDKK